MRATLVFVGLWMGCADITPIEDGKRYGPVVTLQDWFTSCFLLESGDAVVLFDTCWREGTLESGLESHGLKPEDVTHVLMTHGHADHAGGLGLVPQATVMGRQPEQDNLTEHAGEEGKIDQPLEAGQILPFGSHEVHVIAAPGHTPGTTIYWVDGVVILGDAAIATGAGAIEPAPEDRSEDPEAAETVLKGLAARLEALELRVDWLVPAHSGGIEGLAPLRAFAQP